MLQASVKELLDYYHKLEAETIEYIVALKKITNRLYLDCYDADKINEDEESIKTLLHPVKLLYSEFKKRRDSLLEFEQSEWSRLIYKSEPLQTVNIQRDCNKGGCPADERDCFNCESLVYTGDGLEEVIY